MSRLGVSVALAVACGLYGCAHDVVLGEFVAPPADTASGGSAAGGTEAAGGTVSSGGQGEGDDLHTGGAEHSAGGTHGTGGFHDGAGGFPFGGGPNDDDREGPDDGPTDDTPGVGGSGP